MPQIESLASRIDAEFAAVEERIKKLRSEKIEEHKQREKRLEQPEKVFDQMGSIWRPRLELLMKKFEGQILATPRIVPSIREVTFYFKSQLAQVKLKFTASTDLDVEKLVLAYHLEIIPVYMSFKNHDQIEFPLNAIDEEVATTWVDDRLLDFVQTYFSIGENAHYLKDQMVEDPIAHVRFPKVAAASSLVAGGKTYYFIDDEMRQQFEKEQAITSK